MTTDKTPDEPALIIGERRYPRSKLAQLARFLDAAAVPGSSEEAALEKIVADGVASGSPAFLRVMPSAPSMVVIDPLAEHLAAEDAPGEPS